MVDNIKAYIFTELELQLMVSMMGKTSLYGFGSDKSIKGDALKRNTYEAIYSLAKKKYLEYVDKSNVIKDVQAFKAYKFDSLYVEEKVVKLIRNITQAKIIYEINKWDTLENVLIYVDGDIKAKESVGNKVTIVRPNLTNKDELIVSAIKIEEFEAYLLEEGYLPQNALEGLFNNKAIAYSENKLVTFRIINPVSFEEKKIINVYEDLSYDLDDNKRKIYSKTNIIKELEKR
ncbi:MAG: hypothetical protein IJ272_01315 [Clostridia bacterium]|nr:hypothetical protein [Clostridia bacterium]